MKFSKAILNVYSKYNPLFITICGISGTGKTNTAFYISELISKYDNLGEIWYHFYPKSPSMGGIHIYEDFTYLASTHTTQVNAFLRNIQLVRHKVKDRIVLIFIFHYLHSLLPLLRISHVRIITSLLTPYEIRQYKQYFSLDKLWDYYEYFLHGYEHIILANIMGRHVITQLPKSKILTQYEEGKGFREIGKGLQKIVLKDVVQI